MRGGRLVLGACAAVVAIMAPARAQDGERRTVTVRVDAVAGRSVFLDQGRSAGLTEGLRVELESPGAPPVTLTVAAVTASSARCDCPAGMEPPPIGATGTVEVTIAPIAPEPPPRPATAPGIPAHPPWPDPETDRDAKLPLLAPAHSPLAWQRPWQLHGLTWTRVRHTADTGSGRDNTYDSAEAGGWLELTNLFGQGGRFRFDGSVDYERAQQPGGDSPFTRGQMDWCSYAVGLAPDAPWRLEAGRFVPSVLSELGLCDGVEAQFGLPAGFRVGAGVGAYPLPDPDPEWGRDVGFHVFTDFTLPGPHVVQATLGFQHTWNDADPDRAQTLFRFNWRPWQPLWITAHGRWDYYTAHDDDKDAGFELTQGWLQMRFTPLPVVGIAISCSRWLWPDVRNDRYANLPSTLVADGVVDRMGIHAWWLIIPGLRTSGRIDWWRDQDDRGTSGWAQIDIGTGEGGWPTLQLAGFVVDAKIARDLGGRAEIRWVIRGRAVQFETYVGYEASEHEPTHTGLGNPDYLRHDVRGGIEFRWAGWAALLGAHHYSGNVDDAYTVEARLEFRF